MADLALLLVAGSFFALALFYTHGCEKLRGGSRD